MNTSTAGIQKEIAAIHKEIVEARLESKDKFTELQKQISDTQIESIKAEGRMKDEINKAERRTRYWNIAIITAAVVAATGIASLFSLEISLP